MGKMQKYLAEALGTFALVGVGSFAIISASGGDGLGIVSIALGFGLALLIGLYAFGEVSGGHFNPAVSLAMFLDRRITMDDLIGYVVAQFAGAIAASLVVLIAFNDNAVAGTVTQSGDNWAGIVVEFVFTALFVAVILQSSKSERSRGTALLAIPLALVAIHVAAIPISGASVNPARSFGAGADRHRVHRPLDLPDLPAARSSRRLDRLQDRGRGRHEPARRLRRRASSASGRCDGHAPHRRAGSPASDDHRLALPHRGARPGGRPRARRRSDSIRSTCRWRSCFAAAARAARFGRGRAAAASRAAAIATSSYGSTSTPASGVTNSGGPPTAVATTERPEASPSSVASPNGSTRLG